MVLKSPNVNVETTNKNEYSFSLGDNMETTCLKEGGSGLIHEIAANPGSSQNRGPLTKINVAITPDRWPEEDHTAQGAAGLLLLLLRRGEIEYFCMGGCKQHGAAAVFCITAFHFRFIIKLSYPSEVLQVARVALLQLPTPERLFLFVHLPFICPGQPAPASSGRHCLNLYLTTKTDNKQGTW